MDRSLLILSRSCRFLRLRVVAVRWGRRQRPQSGGGMFATCRRPPGQLVANYHRRTVAEGPSPGYQIASSRRGLADGGIQFGVAAGPGQVRCRIGCGADASLLLPAFDLEEATCRRPLHRGAPNRR